MKVYRYWIGLLLLIALFVGCVTAREFGIHVRTDAVTAMAAQVKTPHWDIGLGPALVEEMFILGPNKMLVSLRKYDQELSGLACLLIDRKNGEIIWRLDRKPNPGDFSLVGRGKNILVFGVRDKNKSTLLAVGENDGRVIWQQPIKANAVQFLSTRTSENLFVLDVKEKGAILAAYKLKSGQHQWQVNLDGTAGQSWRQNVLHQEDDLIVCASKITRLSAADGKVLWQRGDLLPVQNLTPPLLLDKQLLFIDQANHLVRLDPVSGHTLNTYSLPKGIAYTNIFPLNDRIYIRGVSTDSTAQKEATYLLVALNQKTGRSVWTLKTRAPILSNILEYRGSLYAGTSKAIVGIKHQNGEVIFKTLMTGLGEAYPVQVRRIKNQIVYISELAIGACDPISGAKIYRHGITPIAHLNNLESRIKQLQGDEGSPKTGKFNWSSYHSIQTSLHQNLARQAYAQWDVSDPFRSSISEIEFSFHNRLSKDHALRSFTAAIDELTESFEGVWKDLVKKAEIRYDRLLKRCIVSAYIGMTQENIVYRPHIKDGFIYLRCIDLRSGGQTDLPLSPEYQSFGIWNIVDPEQGVVYHHGLGLDPGRYEYSEPCWNVKMVYAKWYQSHLMAIPLPIMP